MTFRSLAYKLSKWLLITGQSNLKETNYLRPIAHKNINRAFKEVLKINDRDNV